MRSLGRAVLALATGGALALAASSCTQDDADHEYATADLSPEHAATRVVKPVGNYRLPSPPAENVVPWEQVQAEVVTRIDDANRKLFGIRALSRQERSNLRIDVSAVQIVPARELGIQPGTSLEQLISDGQVVQLPEETSLWVLRDLNYSKPYLVPSAEAMLEEIGNRFQARLNSLGLPHFRLEVTSAFRTADSQAQLRRRNRNAAPTESAHEFGTTFDIAYRKFSPPMDDGTGREPLPLDARGRVVSDSMWTLVARQRGVELQALLGRVLQEMRLEGKLYTRMERSQPVYHTTVARHYMPPGAKNAQP